MKLHQRTEICALKRSGGVRRDPTIYRRESKVAAKMRATIGCERERETFLSIFSGCYRYIVPVFLWDGFSSCGKTTLLAILWLLHIAERFFGYRAFSLAF